jgi:prepilin-type N-terminal cleavage/methylation domain-containing protein
MPRSRIRRGFSLVELMVVIAVVGVLIGLLIPALRNVRESAGETECASNLRQLGAATINYLAVWKDHLPQATGVNPFTGQTEVIGALFGGKRGELQMFGIDTTGADKRPLNKFLGPGTYHVDGDPNDGVNTEDVPYFQCPLDRGQPAQPPFLPAVETMYDFVGSSYTLNDHALDSEDCWTLVPKRTPACDPDPGNPDDQRPGGRMPSVADASKTWMLGDQPIYNYQQGGDRGQHWHFKKVQCNLCFVDGHIGQGIEIPESTFGPTGVINENTTKRYTFLPDPRWLDPDPTQTRCHCPAP